MRSISSRAARAVAAVALLAATLAVASTVTARPAVAAPLDCSTWRYGAADEPATLPPEFDRNDFRRTSLRDARPELFASPHNQCGQRGAAVDLAWGLTRGTPDVRIAVLDSGIMWRNAHDMVDLADQAYINLGEAHPPCWPGVADGDCNSDGRFSIADFGAVADRNGNGVADPEDLILDPAVADGTDADGNGYVDDISGWDFLYGDNDPLDTVTYGHGTGEAEDSTAAENGTGDVGTCPGCRFIPVRVGDSFIADGGRFAAGVLFALDSGADVVQEALGALNNPRQAQQAIDAAYARGVPVVASMADEAAEHPNLPASLERTMAVNSVTGRQISLANVPNSGWLALNGCTNFGAHTFVSIPSNACSSEATGKAAGMMGLLESYARTQGVAPHPDLSGAAGANVLSANEAMQLFRASADDIDFSTPNAVDPANDVGTPTGNPILDTVRYPSRPGWDATFGYGRTNTYELLKLVRAGRIPPEAMIDGPSWFDVLPVGGTVPVTGRVAAVRATTYDYRVEWAPGQQPPPWPATDTWTVAGGQAGLSSPRSGTLATLDLAAIAAALPGGGHGPPTDPGDRGRPDPNRFAVRIRVVVTAHGGPTDGLTGEMQKEVFVHDDPDLLPGFPARIPGVGTASPRFVDLDGDGTAELVVATDDGDVHAYRPAGGELPGFPVHTDVSPWWPAASPTASADAIPPHRGAVMLGGPAIADLDRDGRPEIVVSDLDGRVHVWNATGGLVATMGVDSAFSRDSTTTQDQFNRTKPGFAAAPALADLDGDGTREIVVGALDRHLYAWHHDGTAVAGFPVLLVDPAKVASIDPVSHRVTFAAGSGVAEGGEITAAPTVADLDGDGRPEIVVGAQEEYVEPPNIGDHPAVVSLLAATGTAGNARLYAVRGDGSLLPGWPAKLAMAKTELLPSIGDGVAMPAAVGDVDPSSPGPEIVAASAAGPLYVLSPAGRSVYGTTASGDIPARWSAQLDLSEAGAFGANRTSDDLAAVLVGFGGPVVGEVRPGHLDAAAPTAGLTRLIDLLAPDLQLPNDDQLMVWDGTSGAPLPLAPHATPDLAFFAAPAIAGLGPSGTGAGAHVIAGNALHTLSAVDANGVPAPGWPKLTGGWTVGTPAVGDWNGDGTLEVAQPRRDGVLLVWTTPGRGAASWSGWQCDAAHTGACAVATAGPVTTTTAATGPGTAGPGALPTTGGGGARAAWWGALLLLLGLSLLGLRGLAERHRAP